MSAVGLLCEIIAQSGKASASAYAEHPDFETLSCSGFIRNAGVMQSVTCLDCDIVHDAEIVHENGRYGYFCPEIGFVAIPRAMIEAIKPDFPTIVAALADSFHCKRRKPTELRGATWRIGLVVYEASDVSLYLQPTLQSEQDVAKLMAALSQEVRSQHRLILTASGTLTIPDAKTALLSDVVEIQTVQPAFAVLTDPRDIVEAPRKRPGGAPNRYKEMLGSLIAARKQDGSALPGRNEEAKAILGILSDQKSSKKLPSLSTIQRYLTEMRNSES